MSFTFASSGAILQKAGANVSTNFTGTNAQTNLTQFSDEAEALINATARVDLVAAYADIAADKKKILQDIASAYDAMMAIQYDMTGFLNLAEATTKLNVLNDIYRQGLKIIAEDDWKKFAGVN